MSEIEEVELRNCKAYKIGNQRHIKCELHGKGKIKEEDIIKIQQKNEE